ncbi:hypothetical protein Vretimale_17522 [Volvox reticuliferus]|uniref:Pherophorin domain-containing protein n=2 Tax=Volvox reticuliferus TaxID=1737510 RepID=A0A8J4FU85_9CHLO|nr:hypothetical protein Vretifemale_18194 [Volvox reticuliferus]GIM14591.1 hypothetical protein Vretimale_17522 [Volvox reticuliferus]
MPTESKLIMIFTMRNFTILPLLCMWFVIIVDGRRGLFQSSLGNTFPNYPCQTDPNLSPFKLEPTYTMSPSANGQRICFTGAPIQRCPTEDPCCSQADFYKLELRVRPNCRRAIRSVTVNGVAAPTPTFEVYGPARDMALFKLPRLNLTTANATGSKICITLRDPCPNVAALCPEGDGSCTYAIGQSTSPHKCCPTNKFGIVPPPPAATADVNPVTSRTLLPLPTTTGQQVAVHAVRNPTHRLAPYTGTFPYVSTCNQTTGLMPFRLAGTPVSSHTISGGNVYCVTLEAAPCADPSSSCCSSNLLKVDWWSYDTCRGSVRAYVDKVPYPVTWDQGGTFRLTKLNYSPDDVAAQPKQLCIELRKDGPCDNIQKFCRLGSSGGCTYALYDGSQACCPTANTPALRR